MLIKDSETILEHGERLIQDRTQETTKHALEQQIRREGAATGADAGMDMTDPEQRWGRRMHVTDVIKCLKRMNPGLIFEVSRHTNTLMGIYIMDWVRDDLGTLQYERRFIMGCENGIMPEFTIVIPEYISIPDPNDRSAEAKVKIKQFAGMKRGWRAILVTLLREGLVTSENVMKEFRIPQGRESRIWHEETCQGQAITVTSNGEDKDNGTRKRSTGTGSDLTEDRGSGSAIGSEGTGFDCAKEEVGGCK